MRIVRWLTLILGLIGGGALLPAAAAPLPSAAATDIATTAQARPLVESVRYGWHHRRWGYRHYGWRRPYWHRRHYGWRRHYWRPRYYARPYWHRHVAYRPAFYGYRRHYGRRYHW